MVHLHVHLHVHVCLLFIFNRDKITSVNSLDSQAACDNFSADSSILPTKATCNDTIHCSESEDTAVSIDFRNKIADTNVNEFATCTSLEPNISAVSSDCETRGDQADMDIYVSSSIIGVHRLTTNKWKLVVHRGSKKLMMDLKYIIWLVHTL